MAYKQYNCGMVCWKHYHFLTLGETRNAQVASVIFITLSTCHVMWLTTLNVKNPKSSCPARLFTFENNEAVFRVIIQGRSPKLTHESRTQPVHLDGLFERINLDSSLSIRHVRAGDQLADMLTEGAFTTTQWKSVMRLFDIHLQPKIKMSTAAFPNNPHTDERSVLGNPVSEQSGTSHGVGNRSAWGRPVVHTAQNSILIRSGKGQVNERHKEGLYQCYV